jgi:alcohol dehydrogenase (cytochrome c)
VKWPALLIAASALTLAAQAPVTSAILLHPPVDAWVMPNRDYSAQNYSPLQQINAANVTALQPAWEYHPNAGTGPDARPAPAVKAVPLMINGVLYIAAPNYVWAADARTGRELWQYDWKSNGGDYIGNRGVAVLGQTLYFETPDCNLVALNTANGAERWRRSICDLSAMYYASAAPFIIRNHIIVGISGDAVDNPGYVAAYDPATGALQWRWYAHPAPGTPEAKSWPTTEALLHGGGMTWGYKSYDPELNLLYFGTGNPQPVIAGNDRPGANLYTACIIALDPDTGKLAWYFQVSPHDTHDWDGIQTPVLIDGTIDGKPRKLLANAARNGWFFVLDRTNGKALVSRPFVDENWALGVDDVDAKGQPIPNPEKEPQVAGELSNPNQGGAANWFPPAFNPRTGLFYVDAENAWSIYYIYDQNKKPEGWGGNDRGGYSQASLEAIDYRTGKPRWVHPWARAVRSGLLTTAGNLVFSTGVSSDVEALDASTGAALWHARLGHAVSNAPMTYELDGKQYLVVAGGNALYAFTLASQN